MITDTAAKEAIADAVMFEVGNGRTEITVDKVLISLELSGYVIVSRAPLLTVMDSLAEWANQRGQLHDGLMALMNEVSDAEFEIVKRPIGPGPS